MLGFEFERRRVVLEVRSNEAKARNGRSHRKRACLVDVGSFEAAQQVEHAIKRTQSDRAANVDQLLREGRAARAGAGDAGGQLLDLNRCLRRPIGIVRAALTFLQRDCVLAQALVRRAIEDPQPQPADAHDRVAQRVEIVGNVAGFGYSAGAELEDAGHAVGAICAA
jgi:hypothetical protein